jgi:hypothetical protein
VGTILGSGECCWVLLISCKFACLDSGKLDLAKSAVSTTLFLMNWRSPQVTGYHS